MLSVGWDLTTLELSGDLLPVLVGVEAGEKIRRTRPFGLSAERIAHNKEVAINCGWINGARAERIFQA